MKPTDYALDILERAHAGRTVSDNRRAWAQQVLIDAPVKPGWREFELAVVREFFPVGGWKAVNSQLPHRSEEAIGTKAKILKVKCARTWTLEQETELKALIAAEGFAAGVAQYAQQHPTRPFAGVEKKAFRLLGPRPEKSGDITTETQVVVPIGQWRIAPGTRLPPRSVFDLGRAA